MFSVTTEQMLAFLSVMADEDDMIYYSSMMQGCQTYTEEIKQLRCWYRYD